MLNVSRYKIIAIGKIKKKWIQTGIEMYLKRLPGLQVIEIKDSTQIKEEYTIKGILKKNEALVILNENGQSFSSKLLARKLLNFNNQNITFVIGGATGLSQSLNNFAILQLSLSPLTFPHEIARLLLIEQLYRAKTITQGSPYHKE
ncbi:23S rRNA (pseudouridine(1915)-N(3))-methyltransferase RlmH [Prochlorococcus marinus]|uniref:Ribosomal RNA large subunit methyltransferase H n=1 Tax=Prochlorococcus marinus XMU1408 TaxID=2213228 RepID=A0A318R179_PROMR|nr:23S rRNA (pseudouridine(1915)-N(3))-methyltransferase RlmH [Prochlorococcus marinus]MBW3041905.1 50S rRNA methyltransferase [Prochlorococcus marinus str. XMU1408]PYE03036.1 50S rRNA methyltransferase [Prochlorococcus marinus XMU1408]